MTLQVPNLFRCWPQVASRFKTSRSIALFLDFDGTLAELVPRPEDARLDDSARRTLSQLVESPRFRLWIVSGRRRDDVCARVKVQGIRYLGLHGWEGRSAAPIPESMLQALADVKRLLASGMAAVPGVVLEDKGVTVAVHYRGLTQKDAACARAILREVFAPFSAFLRLIRGKKVWEVVPIELGDKGDAVAAELAALPDPALPVYIGDDVVDEPVFAVLADGITVRVGEPSRTYARYRLPSVAQVHRLLEKLQEEFA